MARRVIRRRRPAGSRVVRRVVRGAAPVAPKPAAAPNPAELGGSPVLMATSNLVRNLILPKLAAIDGISLSGLADSPENALKMLVQEHPEVVVFDMDFGGPFVGLDTARLMQKTRIRAAIVMLVPELDVEILRRESRRFGSSWSYVKKTTAARVDVLEIVLKSAMRGVQWIEPDLSRPLASIWKIAEEARDTEAARSVDVPVTIRAPGKLKTANFSAPEPTPPASDDADDEIDDQDDVAPGIKTSSTKDAETDGLKITTAAIGHGGIGSNVGRVRRSI